MHCKSCIALTEGELTDLPEVTHAESSLKTHTIDVTGDFGDRTPEQIAQLLTEPLKRHGYSVHLEKQPHKVRWADFTYAVPIAAVFVAIFIVLQKLGIVNLVGTGEMTYTTAFVIGLVASVSTCMAVVGGLVLSMSANYAKEGEAVRPQVLFHIGRLVSFFVLGGVIGVLGSVFQLGGTGTFVLSFIVAIILLILGLNLLDVFPWTKKFIPTLPSSFGKGVRGLKGATGALTPLLIGAATFILPCGFTQSMQLYTLTTGSYLEGALTMFVFALGTLPVLALLSFSALSIKKMQTGVFYKTAGLVVIFFGLFNLVNSLV
ncbi:MAG: sulfite exporter TauE/SafE family protein, partial [Rectinemataceae bacterium]|nr:sulfite exporter TauE/SafE family protein [Rectinemataceae bacterium]